MTYAQAIAQVIEWETQDIEETPLHVISIKIEWSESPYFTDGQIFTTVKDFEATMRKAAFCVPSGYDKTNYTVTWSDGEADNYRTDAGDDYTYNYDFFAERKQYRQYLLAHPELIKTYGTDEQTLRDTLEALAKSEAYQRQIES